MASVKGLPTYQHWMSLSHNEELRIDGWVFCRCEQGDDERLCKYLVHKNNNVLMKKIKMENNQLEKDAIIKNLSVQLREKEAIIKDLWNQHGKKGEDTMGDEEEDMAERGDCTACHYT
jgi:hypothetical protein